MWRRVKHLVQLGALSFLDCTLHWVRYNEKASALELVVLLGNVPKGNDGELMAALESSYCLSLRVTFHDGSVFFRFNTFNRVDCLMKSCGLVKLFKMFTLLGATTYPCLTVDIR